MKSQKWHRNHNFITIRSENPKVLTLLDAGRLFSQSRHIEAGRETAGLVLASDKRSHITPPQEVWVKHEDNQQNRSGAEQSASRFAALNRIGIALSRELNETRLLHLIAETPRDLTGAGFAAFTLRPVNELGQPLVLAEGNLFHLTAVVGVTEVQKRFFRHMPLGGEGLLAPIFRHCVPVRVPDALALLHESSQKEEASGTSIASREAARQAAFDYVHGYLPKEGLRYLGVPRGHPLVRSFLGAPLLDRQGQVIGGLLLRHTQPGKFSDEDEILLAGMAAQAGVALENARLYRASQMQAQELDAIFERIADGVTAPCHPEGLRANIGCPDSTWQRN